MAKTAQKETTQNFKNMSVALESATKSLKLFKSTIQEIYTATNKLNLAKKFEDIDTGVEHIKTGLGSINSEVSKIADEFKDVGTGVADIKTGLSSIDLGITKIADEFVDVGAGVADIKTGLGSIDLEIAKIADEQKNLNDKIKSGSKEAMTFKDIFDMLGGIETVKEIATAVDKMIQSDAKLKLIVDDGGSVEELRKKIYSSAQSSGALYTDMVSSVTKLGLSSGDSFTNTDEIIKFTEMVQKMGTISGLSSPELSGVTEQIGQTMSSGGLQTSNYEGIIESMPILGQAISDYMGVGINELKELASQGKITSSVIKAAMFNASNEIDEEFKNMPITWGQIWNGIVNRVLMLSRPLLEFISLLADNWSILEPIILGVALAWGVYTIAVNNAKIVEIAQAVWTGITTAAKVVATTATWLFTRATLKQAAAQHSLNSALLACPLVWIIMIIIALVAVFYIVIAAINKFAGTTLSATGIITGAFAVVGAFICNVLNGVVNIAVGLFIELYNLIATVANFIATIFNNPVAAIIGLFVGLFDVILGVVQSAAKLIDTIIGTKMSESVKDFRSYVAASANDIIGEDKVEIVKKLDQRDFQIQYLDYGNAWNAGNKFGEGIEGKIADSFKFDDLELDKKDKDLNTDNLGNVLDDQEYNVNVKDEVNLADESLKYLLDEVTQKFINNINLQTPAPNVSVQIDVENGSDLDLDAIAEKTKQKLGVEIVEFAMSSTDIKH